MSNINKNNSIAYTVEDLINYLSRYDLDLPVFAWNPDAKQYMPVLINEMLHIDGKHVIILQ